MSDINNNNESGSQSVRYDEFLKLFVSNQKRIYSFIVMLVPNFTDADDIMQDTVEVMWRKFADYESGTSFVAWAVKIARYRVMNYRRTKQRAKVLYTDSLLEAIVDEAVTINDELQDRLGLLRDCREQLSDRDNELLKLRYEKSKSTRDLSDIFNRNMRGVNRDLAKIHAILEKCVRNKIIERKHHFLHGTDDNAALAEYHKIGLLEGGLEFAQQILMVLDGQADPQMIKAFNQTLQRGSQYRRSYVEFLTICIGLNSYDALSIDSVLVASSDESQACDVFLEAIEHDQQRLDKNQEEEKKRQIFNAGQRKSISLGDLIRIAGAIAALVVAGLMLNFVEDKADEKVTSAQLRPVYAYLAATNNARWANGKIYLDDYHFGSQTMILSEGYVEIESVDGAEIVIQGPSEFKFESESQIYLASGTLTANVPPDATGFAVRADNALVVDYGTEFGVAVMDDGRVNASVFKGKISLQSIARLNNVAVNKMFLTEGESATVNQQGSIVEQDRSAVYYRRIMPTDQALGVPGKSLNLADIVGGGNGYGTGYYCYGINPRNGEFNEGNLVYFDELDNKYIQVGWHSYIDGICVPDSSQSRQQISSTGLIWDDCPKTGGQTWGRFLNGAWHESIGVQWHNLKLNNKTYGPDDASIGMHSNKAITFDLWAIRKENPHVNITEFVSICGISQSVMEIWNNESQVDFVVLVDGKRKLTRTLRASDQAERIQVELNVKDRFLTLAVTDSPMANETTSGAYGRDWALFAEPYLKLQAK
ncbi:MAG: sigma-70 family RNA polymerase sigma factor [Phycisphaerae bacterium]|nr:sigma-70 family RNA polymerase sigma factor [Phycisphaerae bacterium]